MVWALKCFRSAMERHQMLAAPLACLGLGGLMLLGIAPAFANESLRSTFPGRLIGGGSRGECAARLVINLVPRSTVFASGSDDLLAVLQGPSSDPRPLEIAFSAYDVEAGGTGNRVGQQVIPAGSASLVLLRSGASIRPLIWESSYQCDDDASVDELSFISAEAPPAVSLLVADAQPEDDALQFTLSAWKSSCGRQLATQAVLSSAGLNGLDVSQWPEQLPVVCAF